MCKDCDADNTESGVGEEYDLGLIMEQQNEADQEYAAHHGIEPQFQDLPGQRQCGWVGGCDRVALEGAYCVKHEKAMGQEE